METIHNNDNKEQTSAREEINKLGKKIDHNLLWPILWDNINARKKEQAKDKEKLTENPHAESDKMKWRLDAAQKGDKQSEKNIDDDIIGRWYPKPTPFFV